MDSRKRVRLITMAWGERYIHELFDFALPAVLAPNNLPALIEQFSCEMVIVTEEVWFDRLRRHPIFHRIEQHCPIALRPIDEFITDPDAYGMALTHALFRGFEDLGASMVDVNLIFFNADFIMADGALRSVAAKIIAGERLILSPSYCVSLEAVGPWLTARRDPETGVLAVPPREMAAVAIQHRHNTIRGKTVNQRLFSQEWIDQFYWLVDQQTLICHQLPIALVCMRPERVLTEMRTFWDYGIISESCPTVTPCVLADSDDFLMIELRQADTAREQIALGWPTAKQIADKLDTFITKDPLDLARYTLILHSGDLPPGLDAAKAELETFVDSVLRELPQERPDHVNHPIWAYHYPRFQEARRRYLIRRGLAAEEPTPIQNYTKPEAARMLEVDVSNAGQLTRPAPPRGFIRRLVHKIYGDILGFAPTLQLAHPRWADVQPVLGVLKGKPNERILVVSSATIAERLFRNLAGTHIGTSEIAGSPLVAQPTAAQSTPPRRLSDPEVEDAEILSVELSSADFPKLGTAQLRSLRLQLVLNGSDRAQIAPPDPTLMIAPPPAAFADPEVRLPSDTFDFCVCELDAEDLLQLPRFVAVIKPAMRRGGKILVFYLNQSTGSRASAQKLIATDALTLDLPCRIHFAGSELTAKAAGYFGNGLGHLRAASPQCVLRGAFLLMRSILLARRINRSLPSSGSDRAPGGYTSVTIEIDVLPSMNGSPSSMSPRRASHHPFRSHGVNPRLLWRPVWRALRSITLAASKEERDVLRLEKEALLKRVAGLESHNALLTKSATELATELQAKKELDYQILMTHQQLLAGITDTESRFRELYEHCKPFTMTSVERLYSVYKIVEHIAKAKIPGDIIECGVWRGGSCMLVALSLLLFEDHERRILLFDTFEGHPRPDADKDVDLWGNNAAVDWERANTDGASGEWGFASLDEVRANLATTGYPAEKLAFVKGKVEDTLPDNIPERLALLRLDTDWYESTRVALVHLYPRLVPGGVLIIDDYGHYQGQRQAVDEYFAATGEHVLLHRIDYSCRVVVKAR